MWAILDILGSEKLFAESSRVKCISHHSTAAVNKRNYLPIFLEGGKAPYFHFQRKMKLGSQRHDEKTGNTHISFQRLIWDKKLLSPVWIKEDSIEGKAYERWFYFQNQKVGSHGLPTGIEYLKLGLSQKIWNIWPQLYPNKISHSKMHLVTGTFFQDRA